MSRRVAVALVFAALVIGWAAWIQPWAPRVPLLTGADPEWSLSCYTNLTAGLLTADPATGTLLDGKPVQWPWGFTARRIGPEVEVLDLLGNVVARTGRRYILAPSGPVSTVVQSCGYASPD